MRTSFLTLLVLSLTACAPVGPNYNAPQMNILDRWFATEPSTQISQEPVDLEWWSVFGDPLLEGFIRQAAKNNKDIDIALANLSRARALRGQERSALFPQVDAQAGASRTKSSDATTSNGNGEIRNLYDAGFDASWEIDIFGGNRRAIEAADARLESARADYHSVMLSTLSEVARNYYEARGLQKRIALTEENTNLFRQTSNLINERLKAGEASEFDLSRARGQYQLTHARLPNLKADLYATVFNLSVLLGQPPEALLETMQVAEPLPTPPDMVPVGLRSDILRRRPDVRMAERELAAATADIGVETSNLFPKFFLTGSAGTQARTFGDLVSANGFNWGLGSLIQWPVFQAGAIRTQIDVEKAESHAALASYEKTVLEALADTETALIRYMQELETRSRLQDAVHSRRKSVRLARQLLDAGEEDYLAVLDAERELTTSEDDLVISETQSITKLIALYTALGGGWQSFEYTE